MSYATASDIEKEFKNITFDTGDAIQASEVTGFIEEEEAVINSTISNRYVIPITGTVSILVMKNITIAFVAYRVAKILNLKKNEPIPEQFVPQNLNEGATRRLAQKLLFDIRNGIVELNDAVGVTKDNGVTGYNANNEIEPIFERDKVQW